MEVTCLLLHWRQASEHKARELDMITRDFECPWHDYYIICRDNVTGADFEISLYAFDQSENR